MMLIEDVSYQCGGSGSRSSSTPEAKNRGPWLAALRPHHSLDFYACPPDLAPARREAGGQDDLTAKGAREW